MLDLITGTAPCLGLDLVIVTADNKIVFGKRSKKVFLGDNWISLPAGGFMPEDQKDPDHPDVFVSAKRQLQDEVGISTFSAIDVLGIASDSVVSPNPTLHFLVRVDLTAARLLEHEMARAKDKYEHDRFYFVNAGDIGALLASGEIQGTRVFPVSLAALLLYGARLNPPEWSNAARADMARRGIIIQNKI